MFIVWGKTIKRQKLGFVADFCAVCRDLRAFQVQRVGSASHVYYISFGDGELVGYERTCQTCATPFETIPDNYSGMAKQVRPPSELISETFPNYYTVYREQIEREKKVRDTPSLLSRPERRQRLRDPFVIVAPYVQQKLTRTPMDARAWLAVAALLPVFWTFMIAGKLLTPGDQEPNPLWAMAGLAFGVAVVYSQTATAARRYILRNTMPGLVQALAPLKPSTAEIDDVLTELKQHNLKLGTKLRADDLLTGIERLRQSV